MREQRQKPLRITAYWFGKTRGSNLQFKRGLKCKSEFSLFRRVGSTRVLEQG